MYLNHWQAHGDSDTQACNACQDQSNNSRKEQLQPAFSNKTKSDHYLHKERGGAEWIDTQHRTGVSSWITRIATLYTFPHKKISALQLLLTSVTRHFTVSNHRSTTIKFRVCGSAAILISEISTKNWSDWSTRDTYCWSIESSIN